ncbi:hypothetical protein Hanom_Chr03g00193511 [Helianthus anomalus]
MTATIRNHSLSGTTTTHGNMMIISIPINIAAATRVHRRRRRVHVGPGIHVWCCMQNKH